MKNLFKLLVSGVVTLAVMSFSAVSAFATDVETNDIETAEARECIMVTATSEGITSITDANGEDVDGRAISGYGYACLRKTGDSFLIYTDEDGYGKAKFTIKTQCNSWNGYTNCSIFNDLGTAITESTPVRTNGETIIWSDKTELNPIFYLFKFRDIPDGAEMHTWIWIYT